MSESTVSENSKLMLPHTANCLVCGRQNPHGLKLDFFVDPSSGKVTTEFAGNDKQVGFDGIVHGGLVATILDEAMVWAATWNIKRFCVTGEIQVRFRENVIVGQKVRVESIIDFSRPKLIEPSAKIFDESNKLLVAATGKYVPLTGDQHGRFIQSCIDDPRTKRAAERLGKR